MKLLVISISEDKLETRVTFWDRLAVKRSELSTIIGTVATCVAVAAVCAAAAVIILEPEALQVAVSLE